jgi:hypothetical protein
LRAWRTGSAEAAGQESAPINLETLVAKARAVAAASAPFRLVLSKSLLNRLAFFALMIGGH